MTIIITKIIIFLNEFNFDFYWPNVSSTSFKAYPTESQ